MNTDTKPTPTRLYRVADRKTGKALRYVNATKPDQALARYCDDTLECHLPSQVELALDARAGVPMDGLAEDVANDPRT